MRHAREAKEIKQKFLIMFVTCIEGYCRNFGGKFTTVQPNGFLCVKAHEQADPRERLLRSGDLLYLAGTRSSQGQLSCTKR